EPIGEPVGEDDLGPPDLHLDRVQEIDRLLVHVDARALVHPLQLGRIVRLQANEHHVEPGFGPRRVELLVPHDIVGATLHPEAPLVAALDQVLRQLPGVGLAVVLVRHDLDRQVIYDVDVRSIRDARDLVERALPALDLVHAVVELQDGAEATAVATAARRLDRVGTRIVQEVVLVAVRIAQLAHRQRPRVHLVRVVQDRVDDLLGHDRRAELAVRLAIVHVRHALERAPGAQLPNDHREDVLGLAVGDAVDLRDDQVLRAQGDVMAANDDGNLRIHLLDLARQLGDYRDVRRVAALERDELRLEGVHGVEQVPPGGPQVDQPALRDVLYRAGQILRSEGLNADGIVEPGRVATLRLDEQDTLDRGFHRSLADDVDHRFRPPFAAV